MMPALVLQSEGLELLSERWHTMWSAAQTGLIDVGLALAVLLVSYVVASLLAWAVAGLLRAARFNDGVRHLLGPDIVGSHEPANVAAGALQWLIVITGCVLSFDMLGFRLGDELARRLNEVLPRVLAAALLLGAGIILAMALGALTRRFFDTSGLGGGRLRGQAVTVLFTLFSALLALDQLGFAAQFVMTVGEVGVGAIGLGVALAFGLGCRDLARDFIVEYLRSLEQDRSSRP